MIERNLARVWGQLRGAKPQWKDFLDRVRIRGLRGISDLSVGFAYPVSVLAGPNACGKSAVLFSLACAYKVPGAGIKDFVPSTMFPTFKSKSLKLQDTTPDSNLEYHYLVAGDVQTMQWARTKRGWDRRKSARQPERALFFRTLANLSNPSEVRSYLQMGREKDLTSADVDASLLSLAHRILPFEFQQLSVISPPHSKKELLFAVRVSRSGPSVEGPQYSEFHMSAGERSVLRLSAALSKLDGALVLIDEIETGLHPILQQQLMLELQLLALRNRLQIIVTTHSNVVIEAVPEEGRIFLERNAETDNVQTRAPYRDIIQRAMYGASRNKLSVLCEDEVAEGLALGIFDYLGVKLQILPSDIVIGRDTGKTEFQHYIKSLGRFRLLDDFIFLLDGDARDLEVMLRETARSSGKLEPSILFLPGTAPPEEWIWQCLERNSSEYADELSVPKEVLEAQLRQLFKLYESASTKDKAKERFYSLCGQFLMREQGQVARVVGKREATRGELFALTQSLENAVNDWRSHRER